jgi:hypothetical protein
MTTYKVHMSDRMKQESVLPGAYTLLDANLRVVKLAEAQKHSGATFVQHHAGLSVAFFPSGEYVEFWRGNLTLN